MEVTVWTWIVSLVGALMVGALGILQLIAVLRPRGAWTIENLYSGTPEATDPKAFFAFNQGWAWVDAFLLAPLQIAGSLGMVLGHRWGFLVALMASVPLWYTAVPLFVWDRDLGFRGSGAQYWVAVWGMWPAFGILESTYCVVRLLE